MQDRLNTMIGKSSGFVETLPKQVQARIQALRSFQVRFVLTASLTACKNLFCTFRALAGAG